MRTQNVEVNRPQRNNVKSCAAYQCGVMCQKSMKGSDGRDKGRGPTSKSCLWRGVTVTIPYWILAAFVTTTILFLGLEVFGLVQQWLKPQFTVSDEVINLMGLDGVIMFRQNDRNQDGVLDLAEFEPLAHRLFELNVTKYDFPSNASDELVTLEAYFTPMPLSSLSSENMDQLTTVDSHQLGCLTRWKSAAKKSMQLSTKYFESWMANELDSVGKVYDIIDVPTEIYQGIPLSNNRYLSPLLTKPSDILLHTLLSMFHPHPLVISRYHPHGGIAVTRATNSRSVDIVFRFHAEFQICEPPSNPFWFTPAQFTGHVTIDRDVSHVHQFQLYVPNNRKLNVDMEWITGFTEEFVANLQVDIGYLPEMTINISQPSSHHVDNAADNMTAANHDIEWTHEISMEEALELLEVDLYAHKKIKYHNVTEAFDLAAEEGKLVHHIMLWGALDDQSC